MNRLNPTFSHIRFNVSIQSVNQLQLLGSFSFIFTIEILLEMFTSGHQCMYLRNTKNAKRKYTLQDHRIVSSYELKQNFRFIRRKIKSNLVHSHYFLIPTSPHYHIDVVFLKLIQLINL